MESLNEINSVDCPQCGADCADLNHNDLEICKDGESIRCRTWCSKCDYEGYEFYNVSFLGFTTLDGDKILWKE